MHHVTKQNVVSDWFHDEHDDEISSSVPFPVTGSESTRSTLGRSRTEHSQHESAPETFAGHAILSTWTRCVLLPMPFTSPLFCAELHRAVPFIEQWHCAFLWSSLILVWVQLLIWCEMFAPDLHMGEMVKRGWGGLRLCSEISLSREATRNMRAAPFPNRKVPQAF